MFPQGFGLKCNSSQIKPNSLLLTLIMLFPVLSLKTTTGANCVYNFLACPLVLVATVPVSCCWHGFWNSCGPSDLPSVPGGRSIWNIPHMRQPRSCSLYVVYRFANVYWIREASIGVLPSSCKQALPQNEPVARVIVAFRGSKYSVWQFEIVPWPIIEVHIVWIRVLYLTSVYVFTCHQ